MATALLHCRWNADIQFIYFQTQSLTSQCFHTNFLEDKSWSIFQTKTNLTKRYPIGFSMVASTNLHRKKSESEWVRGKDREAHVEMAHVWLRTTFRSIAKLLIFVQKDKKMWAQQKTLRNCIGVQFYSVSLIFLWFLLMRLFYDHEKIWRKSVKCVYVCSHTTIQTLSRYCLLLLFCSLWLDIDASCNFYFFCVLKARNNFWIFNCVHGDGISSQVAISHYLLFRWPVRTITTNYVVAP